MKMYTVPFQSPSESLANLAYFEPERYVETVVFHFSQLGVQDDKCPTYFMEIPKLVLDSSIIITSAHHSESSQPL